MRYDEMEAGVSLDILVAEKIFGCKPLLAGQGSGYRRQWARCGCERGEHNYNDDGPRDGCLLRFSTGIAEAMQVVEKMADNWYVIDLCIEKNSDAFVEIHRQASDGTRLPLGRSVSSAAPAAPLAICRAALKAVDPEVAR